MSYTLTLECGCKVSVTGAANDSAPPTRLLHSRHPVCRLEGHRVGVRVWLWELLPQPARMADDRLRRS